MISWEILQPQHSFEMSTNGLIAKLVRNDNARLTQLVASDGDGTIVGYGSRVWGAQERCEPVVGSGGRVILNTAPPSGGLAAVTVPPWRATTSPTSARPMP
jgi:hypothetical protein